MFRHFQKRVVRCLRCSRCWAASHLTIAATPSALSPQMVIDMRRGQCGADSFEKLTTFAYWLNLIKFTTRTEIKSGLYQNEVFLPSSNKNHLWDGSIQMIASTSPQAVHYQVPELYGGQGKSPNSLHFVSWQVEDEKIQTALIYIW